MGQEAQRKKNAVKIKNALLWWNGCPGPAPETEHEAQGKMQPQVHSAGRVHLIDESDRIIAAAIGCHHVDCECGGIYANSPMF